MKPSELQREILDRGLSDYVVLAELVGDLSLQITETDLVEVRDMCLDAVRALVEAGLVEPGVLRDGKFVARPGELDRIVEETLAAYDGDPMGAWQYCLWLSNTTEGDRRAELNEQS